MRGVRCLVSLVLAGLAARAGAAELAVEWAPLAVAVESYQVERRVDAPGEEFVPLVRVSARETRFLDRHVAAGVRYCYRVRGVRGERYSPPSPPLCSVAAEAKPAPPADSVSRPADPETVGPGGAAAAARAEEPTHAPAPEEASAALLGPAAPTALDREAKALRRPPPHYPQRAILEGLSGWVKVRFTVSATGTTKDIEVVAAEPPGVFEEAAVEAVERFLYSPRIVRGVAVDRPGVETDLTFTLMQGGSGGELLTGRQEPGPR